jgi:anti-sigma factor RsiW
MNAACRKVEETFLHAYVDGEFTAEESADIQAHLDGCAPCMHVVRRHQSYKAAMARANLQAPHALHDGVRDHLVHEAAQGRWSAAFRDPRGIAVAAAAVGAAAWFLAGGLTHPLFATRHSLVEDGVALHARALPLDYAASDVGSAQAWLAGKLDFGVRLPRFAHGTRLQGVRISSVHERPAAVVSYALPQAAGRRVSLLIVDDPEQLLAGASRRIADREVWVSRLRGFNVASWRNDEIVYSLISDLDEQDVLALVESAELR